MRRAGDGPLSIEVPYLCPEGGLPWGGSPDSGGSGGSCRGGDFALGVAQVPAYGHMDAGAGPQGSQGEWA